MHAFKWFAETGINAIFPPRCAGCDAWSEDIFCTQCRVELHHFAAPLCHVCGAPFDALAKGANLCSECRPSRYHRAPAFAALRSCYRFEGPVREAIHHYKYENRKSLAAPLADELVSFWRKNCNNTLSAPHCDITTFVPLHRWRHYRRGYNQSELLANHFAARLHIPSKVLLRRIRPTLPQVSLGRKQRTTNMKGAFAADAQMAQWHGKTVLLIDDVCTTGATLRECARVLKQNGAKDVYALTLARQIAQ